MDRQIEKTFAAKAVALGKSGDPAALGELVELIKSPSAQVRKLSVSAIGKLAGLVDPKVAVAAVAPVLSDSKPQNRQYAIKALAAYGIYSRSTLHTLQDIANNPSEPEYNRRDAALATETIREALRIEEARAVHACTRCSVVINSDEYARSQKAFQRSYCDKCFDEVYLKRRNFDTRVELKKTIRAKDGTLVQSDGERRIAEWLTMRKIPYRYDERFRIIEGMAIRPDFYLPELDVYIEYWGMDTADYKIGMLKKQKLYQQEGKKLISLYPEDKDNLDISLAQKLGGYVNSQ